MTSFSTERVAGNCGATATEPRVTIMIPTFNQSQFLYQAVKSALAQDYQNLEIVICDDASTDDTREVVTGLLSDDRVRYFRNANNLGRVGNYRHILYDLATGDWVINLDGDDCFISRSYISSAVRLALSHPDITLVFGKAEMGPSTDGATVCLNERSLMSGVMDGTQFFLEYPPFETMAPLHATCLYHRASAMKIGFYKQDILSSDFESLYRLMLDRKIGFVDEVAALWRQHGENATRSPTIDGVVKNIAVFEGPYQRAKELGCLSVVKLRQWRRQRFARYFLSSLMQTMHGRLPFFASLCLAGHLFKRDPLTILALPTIAVRAFGDLRRRDKNYRD